VMDGLRQYYIHTITVEGVKAKANSVPVLHPIAYYTLNSIPNGDKLPLSDLSTRNSSNDKKASVIPGGVKKPTIPGKVLAPSKNAPETKGPDANTAIANSGKTAAPTYDQVKGLLTSYTCIACHNPTKKLVGPAFSEIAKRKYTAEKIVSLIHNPQPQNWPTYPTEMPPMPQVTKADGLKIAAYINSLAK